MTTPSSAFVALTIGAVETTLQLEIAEIYGKATAGVIKDTIVVPTYGRASVDFTADQPGPALFHCHIQQHMDFGFKALLRYM
jgi:FtsP/CotA-like multicopper oxidase with cupredoxin domain